MPADLAAPGEQLLAVLDGADEPLAASEDLHRTLPLLEVLDGTGDLDRLADQIPRALQQFDHLAPRRLHRQAFQLGVGAGRRGRILALPALAPPLDLPHAAVGGEDHPDRQRQLSPPDDVGDVAEGADHHQAGPLVLLDQGVGEDRDRGAEQGRPRGAADELAVAVVVRVGEEGDAGRDQLRPSGLDQQPVAAAEAHPVHRSPGLAVLELGLGDRGAEVDVPEGRRLGLVHVPGDEVSEEGRLGNPLRERPDRRVGHRPVDRETEPAPKLLEGALVLGGQPQAEVDEVGARDVTRRVERLHGGLELRVGGDRGIAPHPVVVLHAPLGRQAVVVPAHRVDDRLAAHPLIARDRVSVGVGEDVADVERSAHRRRRRVDRVHPIGRGFGVKPVYTVLLPAL